LFIVIGPSSDSGCPIPADLDHAERRIFSQLNRAKEEGITQVSEQAAEDR